MFLCFYNTSIQIGINKQDKLEKLDKIIIFYISLLELQFSTINSTDNSCWHIFYEVYLTT